MGWLPDWVPNPGKLFEKASDALGLPEPVGDLASGAVNYLTGNHVGLLEDGLDLLGLEPPEPGGTDPQPPKRKSENDDEPPRIAAGETSVATRAGGADEPPVPMDKNAAAVKGPVDWKQALADIRAGRNPEGLELDPGDLAMLRYQEETQRYNRMITFLTQMLTVQHDTQKAAVQNLRV